MVTTAGLRRRSRAAYATSCPTSRTRSGLGPVDAVDEMCASPDDPQAEHVTVVSTPRIPRAAASGARDEQLEEVGLDFGAACAERDDAQEQAGE